jgi:exonuclease VII large subunit
MAGELEELLAEMREMEALYDRLDRAAGEAAALLVEGDAERLQEVVSAQERLLSRANEVYRSTERRRQMLGEALLDDPAYAELNEHLLQAAQRLQRRGMFNLALAQTAVKCIRCSMKVLGDEQAMSHVPAERTPPEGAPR